MPDIIVTDPNNVTIDGAAAGSVVDLIANHAADPADPAHAAFRAALHDAILASHAATTKAHSDAVAALEAKHADELKAAAGASAAAQEQHAAELQVRDQLQADAVAGMTKQHADNLEKVHAAHAEEIRRRHGAHTAAQAEFKRHRQMIDDLGGEQAWLATAPGRRAALLAAQAQIEAALAAHDAVAAPQAGA